MDSWCHTSQKRMSLEVSSSFNGLFWSITIALSWLTQFVNIGITSVAIWMDGLLSVRSKVWFHNWCLRVVLCCCWSDSAEATRWDCASDIAAERTYRSSTTKCHHIKTENPFIKLLGCSLTHHWRFTPSFQIYVKILFAHSPSSIFLVKACLLLEQIGNGLLNAWHLYMSEKLNNLQVSDKVCGNRMLQSS